MTKSLLLLLTALSCSAAGPSTVFQVDDLFYATLDETTVEVVRLREGYTLDEVQVPSR